MAKTLDEVRKAAMELTDEERVQLSEELACAQWAPGVREKWVAESERRYDAMISGEEPSLTLEEFWRDEE